MNFATMGEGGDVFCKTNDKNKSEKLAQKKRIDMRTCICVRQRPETRRFDYAGAVLFLFAIWDKPMVC
jgi:hypothetical protein